jgi:hypothetical protein
VNSWNSPDRWRATLLGDIHDAEEKAGIFWERVAREELHRIRGLTATVASPEGRSSRTMTWCCSFG